MIATTDQVRKNTERAARLPGTPAEGVSASGVLAPIGLLAGYRNWFVTASGAAGLVRATRNAWAERTSWRP